MEGDGVQGNGIGERVHDQMARVRADLAELVLDLRGERS